MPSFSWAQHNTSNASGCYLSSDIVSRFVARMMAPVQGGGVRGVDSKVAWAVGGPNQQKHQTFLRLKFYQSLFAHPIKCPPGVIALD